MSVSRHLERILPGLKRLDPSKQSIMWGLLLLVGLFLAGLWIMSSLNLKYSQQAMSNVRQQQIEDGFHAHLDRINAEHQRLEQYTDDLVQQAALFARLNPKGGISVADLEQELLQRLQRFPAAFGSGVWYRAGVIQPRQPFGALAYRSGADTQMYAGTDLQWQDYRQQIWYPLALGTDWREQGMDNKDHYWTPVYYNPLTDAAVISLIRPLRTAEGALLGLISADWHADTLIERVSRIEMTPGSFAWLIDRNGRRLSSLSQIKDARHAERLMAAVEQQLSSVQRDGRSTIQVEDRDFALFHATTRGGMVFGIGVPRDEIDAVLAPMRSTNLRILLLGGLGILLLSGLVLFKVAALMRELQASYTDELTGLPNRARLLLDLQQRQQAALILLNLDRFRQLNGLLGHACGDYILTTLVARLQASSLQGRHLYRLGADEFVLLGAPLAVDALGAELQRLLHFVQAQQLYWQGHDINLSVTLGAAVTTPDRPVQRCDLINEAQEALKQARQHGLNYRIHDNAQSLEQQFAFNLRWANRLREALRTDRLQPWYQPILNTATGQVEKYECLVRMIDEEGSAISPGHFLGVARQLRLDRQITRLMIEKCCHHFANSELQFSINLAYGDLRDGALTAFILEQLDKTGVGSRLIFEILESDGIDNYDQVRHFIEEVKTRGCRIAIDDFGTGYSNFAHLLRLDVDLLKIDGSLIRHLHTDVNARRVTRGIVSFAHSLGIQTVAEFVHSAAVLEQVQQLGIDFAQGELIGMPGPDLLGPN